jgi:hypothetical protein
MQASMEAVDAELDNIAPAQIVGVTAGRLLLANSSGVVTGTAISGDATISNTGVLTIGDDKIKQSMIDNNAVGRDQLADNAVGTNEIEDAKVTGQKIANGAVTRSKLSGFIQTKQQVVLPMNAGIKEVTITWDQAFPDNTYTAVVSVLETNPLLTGVQVQRISAKLAGSIKVTLANNGSDSACTIQAIAIA